MRERLKDRRAAVTRRVRHVTNTGQSVELLVTVGFDSEHRVREVFCADFKAGSDLHGTVMAACILLSRLLQHGDSAAELRDALGAHSLIKTLAAAAAEEDLVHGG